jgi:ammonia channel protein AmtB
MGNYLNYFNSSGFTTSARDLYLYFFHELSFAITSVAIVSGTLIERA